MQELGDPIWNFNFELCSLICSWTPVNGKINVWPWLHLAHDLIRICWLFFPSDNPYAAMHVVKGFMENC